MALTYIHADVLRLAEEVIALHGVVVLAFVLVPAVFVAIQRNFAFLLQALFLLQLVSLDPFGVQIGLKLPQCLLEPSLLRLMSKAAHRTAQREQPEKRFPAGHVGDPLPELRGEHLGTKRKA